MTTTPQEPLGDDDMETDGDVTNPRAGRLTSNLRGDPGHRDPSAANNHVRAAEPVHLPRSHGQAKVVDGRDLSVVLGQRVRLN